MHCIRKVTDDLYWIGANDHRLHLFENIHPIPEGVSYNAYFLDDEKTVLFDTVDWSSCRQLIENLEYLLDGRDLDYLVVNHMEPDHAASMEEVLLRYPHATIISTEKSFMLMRQFGFNIVDEHPQREVVEGDTQSFGKHEITFVEAQMVHWPEVMVSFDTTNGVLFSADAFGSFKAIDGKLFADEVNWDRDWLDEGRRYYTNIVGKYGPHVMHLLGKAATIPIQMICPLHGLVWRKDIPYLLDKYVHWATYEPEERGVQIVYASMYGNTEAAACALATKICERGVSNVVIHDVSNTDVSTLISDTFKYSHLVLASVTYNLNIYPVMEDFLCDMRDLNLQNRTVAIVENGSWAPTSGDKMQDYLEQNLKNIDVLEDRLSLASSLHEDKEVELERLADAIVESVRAQEEQDAQKAAKS